MRELAERGVMQGNPGAYLSTADVTEVSVPPTLQATIAARIDRLDPKAKRTLSAAAVVGSRFGLDLLDALGVEPAVADLVAAELVDQVGFTRKPEFVFRNPVIRAVAYESQLRSDRAELHGRLAAAIEERGSADENAALIAEHLEAAGDLRDAYDWRMRAAAWSSPRDIRAARLNWERARWISDAIPGSDSQRTALRIAPRTMLSMSTWRVGGGLADTDSTTFASCARASVTTSRWRSPCMDRSHCSVFSIGTTKRRCWRPSSSIYCRRALMR